MSYLVMETNRAYAVVLDGDGRFLKTANLNYQVGDTPERVIPLQAPSSAKRRGPRVRAISLLAAAACFTALLFGAYQTCLVPCGTVRLTINPDVLLTVSRAERVLGLEGLNADGAELIAGYDYRGKDKNAVTAELVELAADMGYVSDGGQVSITLSGSEPWRASAERDIASELGSAVTDVALTVSLSSQGESEPSVVINTAPESDYWKSLDPGQLAGAALPELGGRLEEWGEQAGERIGEWGEQAGEQIGEWGEQAGEQIGRTFGSAEYWTDMIEDGIAAGGRIGGIVGDIIGVFR